MADQQLGRNARILVVDGCAVSRKATHGLLQRLGYRAVDFSGNNRTALRSIAHTPYNLVFADWEAATADGMDLRHQTRIDLRLRYLPFLMAIPRWQKKFIEIVREDGATLYLTRPFTGDILRQRMNQVRSDAIRLHKAAAQKMVWAPGAERQSETNAELWRALRPD